MPTQIPEWINVRYCPAVPVAVLVPGIRRSDNSPAHERLLPSVREAGIVEPLLVFSGDGGLVVEVGNHRLVVAASLGIATVPCIVCSSAETTAQTHRDISTAGPPPDGERLLTVEDMMARLANPPEHLVMSGPDDPDVQGPPGRRRGGPNITVDFHDFTRRSAVPHGPAEIAGRRGAEEERFGPLAEVIRLSPSKPGSFCHGAWGGWRVARRATAVLALSGEAWLLQAGPDGPPRDSVHQEELRAGQEAAISAGGRYCLRTYAGGGAELAVVPPGQSGL
jgi:hypothetical protein